jgi:hypothetical protein
VQLQQVLLNLVINACDAMAGLAGERKLTIISRSLADTEVEFSVWDIGPGLPPGALSRSSSPSSPPSPTAWAWAVGVQDDREKPWRPHLGRG